MYPDTGPMMGAQGALCYIFVTMGFGSQQLRARRLAGIMLAAISVIAAVVGYLYPASFNDVFLSLCFVYIPLAGYWCVQSASSHHESTVRQTTLLISILSFALGALCWVVDKVCRRAVRLSVLRSSIPPQSEMSIRHTLTSACGSVCTGGDQVNCYQLRDLRNNLVTAMGPALGHLLGGLLQLHAWVGCNAARPYSPSPPLLPPTCLKACSHIRPVLIFRLFFLLCADTTSPRRALPSGTFSRLPLVPRYPVSLSPLSSHHQHSSTTFFHFRTVQRNHPVDNLSASGAHPPGRYRAPGRPHVCTALPLAARGRLLPRRRRGRIRRGAGSAPTRRPQTARDARIRRAVLAPPAAPTTAPARFLAHISGDAWRAGVQCGGRRPERQCR